MTCCIIYELAMNISEIRNPTVVVNNRDISNFMKISRIFTNLNDRLRQQSASKDGFKRK